MTDVYSVAESLIKSVKAMNEASGIRFVKGWRKAQAEIPVSGFLAVVSIDNDEPVRSFLGGLCKTGLKGERRRAQLTVTVYDCESGSGNELGLCALGLLKALDAADTSGFLSGLSVGAVRYDSDTGAVCRDVKAKINYFYCEAA